MRTVLRLGLALLTLHSGVPALWAVVSPASFYANFPTPSQAWLTLFPPYNEHMTYDFGLATLQFALVVGYAAVVLQPALVRVVLVASFVFTLPHFLYHQHHLTAGSDVLVQIASQVIPIALVLILLVVNERTRHTRGRTAHHGIDKTNRDSATEPT